MAIKLYNLSGLPDEPMRSLLMRAKRAWQPDANSRRGYRHPGLSMATLIKVHRHIRAAQALLQGGAPIE